MAHIDVINKLTLAQALGVAFTNHALAPGMGESTVDAQHTRAIAYWQAQLSSLLEPTTVQPTLATATAGGTVLAGLYTVAVSYTNANGETTPGPSGVILTTGTTSTITITSPAAQTGATGWYAYVSQLNAGALTRQQAAGSPTAIGTPLVLTAPPTSSGLAPQTLNTTSGLEAVQATAVADAVNHLSARQAHLRSPGTAAAVADR